MPVTGIAFVSCSTSANAGAGGGQVFPSADGVVEWWLEPGGAPRNRRATPHCGEARFAEYEFPSTDSASAGGGVTGRATLEELDDGDGPAIYALRSPASGSDLVWRFRPITGDLLAVTSTHADAVDGLDVAARDYSGYRGYLSRHVATDNYIIRRWPFGAEGAVPSFSLWWDFASGQQPENIDLENRGAELHDFPIFWAAGDKDSGTLPFVMRCDDDDTQWTLPTPTGHAYNYVDTIQCVGPGEAIGVAKNIDALDDSDFLSIFRFTVGEAEGVEITDGCTVDGVPYRTWAASEADNIAVQAGRKMAVLGNRVAAETQNDIILIGTLVRAGGWRNGKAGSGGSW